MRRRLARIFIGCCLALSLISASLYVLTHWRTESWSRPGPRTWDADMRSGRLTLRVTRTELFTLWHHGETPRYRPTTAERLTDWPDRDWAHAGRWVTSNAVHSPLGVHLEWRDGQQSKVWGTSEFDDLFHSPDGEGRRLSVWMETYDERVLVIPLLGFSLLLLVPVLAALLAALARRQCPPGTCMQCGYDIRYSRDRCPECGLGSSERKPLRVGWCAPVLAAVAVVLAAAIAFASWSTGQAVVASALHVPVTDISLHVTKRPPIHVTALAVWVADGTLLVAGTRDQTQRSRSLPLGVLAESAVPPVTGIPRIEPTFRVIDDRSREIVVLRLPVWLVLLLLIGGAAAWVHRMHHRGGFRITRVMRSEPASEEP